MHIFFAESWAFVQTDHRYDYALDVADGSPCKQMPYSFT